MKIREKMIKIKITSSHAHGFVVEVVATTGGGEEYTAPPYG